MAVLSATMKLLFFARHWSYLRNFESAIEALAQRGHHVHMVVSVAETLGGRQMVERLVARCPGQLSMGQAPVGQGLWFELARRIRLGLDYLRYLEPRYEGTPQLRVRAEERTPAGVLALLRLSVFRTDRGREWLARTLRAFERALPRVKAFKQFIAAQQPDAVLITPLVDLGSPQLDYLRAAKALGLRTVLPVCSWDHLSTKALLRVVPDAVIVWNDVQRTEAIEMHHVPVERVVVTGAQCYDQWWSRAPSRTREAFCEHVGLRPDRPFVLYVCSSLLRKTADEPTFVLNWIHALRSSNDPRLKDVGLLIRPHPTRLREWQSIDLTGYPQVVFFGEHPVDGQSKDDYFDSLYYSAAVVGLVTSAFVEAAVVGRPVHTVLLPEISRANQEGTIHFRYLLADLLHAARSFDEHVRMLADSLRGEGVSDPRSRAFAGMFVRPFGMETAATPRFVDAIEKVLLAAAPKREHPGLGELILQLPLYVGLALMYLRVRAPLWWKHLRSRVHKEYLMWRMRLLGNPKRFVLRQLASTRRSAAVPPGPLAQAPERGRGQGAGCGRSRDSSGSDD
jgi:hypothetical protein